MDNFQGKRNFFKGGPEFENGFSNKKYSCHLLIFASSRPLAKFEQYAHAQPLSLVSDEPSKFR